MLRITAAVVAGMLAGCWLPVAVAAESAKKGDAREGLAYARGLCSTCHAVSPDQETPPSAPVKGAPRFQDIANERTTSMIGLNVFLVTPHSKMPNLILPAQDRANIIAYIMSLRGRT